MSDRPLRFGFAGDRDISVWVLDSLLRGGFRPEVLLVSGADRASHDGDLVSRCEFLSQDRILRGDEFRAPAGVDKIRELELDFILGIHFPYMVPQEILEAPREGVLNLHPAYLPFNRGWHTPSWAILEGTPAGATLHFMSDRLDEGDIVHQKRIEVSPADTADSLYMRLKALELEVFEEAWPLLAAGQFSRSPQDPAVGTAHRRAELFTDKIQKIDLEETVRAEDLLRRLRALTTNSVGEAAYFKAAGRRYRVHVAITEDPEG